MSAVIRQTIALVHDEPFFEQMCDLGGFALDRRIFDPLFCDDVSELGHLMMFCLAAAVEAPEWAQAITESYRRGLRAEILRDEFAPHEQPSRLLAAASPVEMVTEVTRC